MKTLRRLAAFLRRTNLFAFIRDTINEQKETWRSGRRLLLLAGLLSLSACEKAPSQNPKSKFSDLPPAFQVESCDVVDGNSIYVLLHKATGKRILFTRYYNTGVALSPLQ